MAGIVAVEVSRGFAAFSLGAGALASLLVSPPSSGGFGWRG